MAKTPKLHFIGSAQILKVFIALKWRGVPVDHL